jgi:hypothetical protein
VRSFGCLLFFARVDPRKNAFLCFNRFEFLIQTSNARLLS